MTTPEPGLPACCTICTTQGCTTTVCRDAHPEATNDAGETMCEGCRGVTIIPLPMWDRPPLRANDRRSWQAQHRTRAKAMEEARWAIRAARPEPRAGAIVTLHYRVPDRRRRDSDGPEPTKKVCIDALVLEGVLPDDSWVHVPRSSVEIHPPTGEPAALWLELEEVV